MSAIEAAERIVAHFKNRNPIGGMEAHALTVARALLAAQPSADDREAARKIALKCCAHQIRSSDASRWNDTCVFLIDDIAAALASRAADADARIAELRTKVRDTLGRLINLGTRLEAETTRAEAAEFRATAAEAERDALRAVVEAAPALAEALKHAVAIIRQYVPADALGTNSQGGGDGWNDQSWPILDEHLHYMDQALTNYAALAALPGG